MASGSGDGPGDQRHGRRFANIFSSRKSRASAGPSTTPPAATSTPPAATTPPATTTPPAATTSTYPYHSPDPQVPASYPYTPYPSSAYPYPPPHTYYPPPPHYSTYPPAPAFHSPVPPPPAPQPDAAPPAASSQDTRLFIEPEGDTFNPHKQATHKIRDLIRSNFDAPYLSWKKIPQGVRDMWFREFQRDFQWQPQYNDRIRRNFEHRGSVRMRDMFTDIRKSGERPLWIGERVWGELCAAWESPEYTKKRAQNKQNRASDCGGVGTSLHTGGARPHTEYRRQLTTILGREPTMSEMHAQTHQRRDNQEWVDARAQQAHEEYNRLREQQSQASAGEGSSAASSIAPSDFELWTQAVGGKKKGRTYGLGSQGPAFEAQTAFTSPSDYTGRTVHDMMAAQQRMHQEHLQQMQHMEQVLQQQMQQQQQQMQQHQEQMQQQMQQQMQEFMRMMQMQQMPPPQPPQQDDADDEDDS